METNRITVPIASFLLGLLPGLFVVWLHTKDLRWILVFGAALPIAVFWWFSGRRRTTIWYAFVLGTQAYVSVRILHGHASSEGIEFPLMFLLGVGVAACELIERDGNPDLATKIRFGGPLGLPIFLILATSANSILFSTEQFVGVTGLARVFQLYVLYWVGLNCVGSPERLRSTVHLLAGVLLMQSAVFFLQAISGVTFSLSGDVYADRGVRAGGTVGANSAIYATFVAPIALLLATRVLSPLVEKRERIILALPLAAGLLSILFTLRRGAWGGVALGFLWVSFVGARRKAVFAWLPGACVAALIAGVLAGTAITEIIDQYRPDNPMDEAFDERLNLMRIAATVISQNPVAGVGIAAYPHVLKSYVPPDLNSGWVSTVHNYYLLVAAETGIPGLIAFVLFLVFAGRLALQRSKSPERDVQLTAIGIGGAVVSHAFAVAWEPLRDFSPNALLWFLIGMLAAAGEWSRERVGREG